MEYLITVFPETIPTTGISLQNISNYTISNVGKQVNRMQFVNNSLVYYQTLPYNSAYIDISFSGIEELATCQDIENLYKIYQEDSNNSIKFVDIYGHSFDNVYIKSFNFNWIKAKGAYSYSIELIVINDTDYLFKIGNDNVVYGIESCEISEKLGEYDTVLTPTSNKILIKKYSSRLFNISINGTEIIDNVTFEGKYSSLISTDVFDLTIPPTSITFKALLLDRNISLIAGQSGFQKFSLNFIASLDANDFIEDTGTLIESYSITDESARISEHRTIGGFVLQKFAPVTLKEINLSLYTNDDTQYPNGTEITNFSEAGLSFSSGWIKGKNIDSLSGNVDIKRVSLNIKVLV